MYRLRLMFEWGGGTVWCKDAATISVFDVGPLEERLPLSAELLARLDALSKLHDTSLNWEYPPDPGPWTQQQYAEFEIQAQEALNALRAELGSNFEIEYDPVGEFQIR